MITQALPKLQKFTVVGLYSGDSGYEPFVDLVKAVDANAAEAVVRQARNSQDDFAAIKAGHGGGEYLVLTVFAGHAKSA
jgi:hypothetical protein